VSQNLSQELEAGVAGMQALSAGLVQWGQGLLGAAARVLGDVDNGNRHGVGGRGDALRTSLRSRGGVRVGSRRHAADTHKALIPVLEEERQEEEVGDPFLLQNMPKSTQSGAQAAATVETPGSFESAPVLAASASVDEVASADPPVTDAASAEAIMDMAESWVAPALTPVLSGTGLLSSDEDEAGRRGCYFSSDEDDVILSAPQRCVAAVTDVGASWTSVPPFPVPLSNASGASEAFQSGFAPRLAAPVTAKDESLGLSHPAPEGAAMNDLRWRPEVPKATWASSDSDEWTKL